MTKATWPSSTADYGTAAVDDAIGNPRFAKQVKPQRCLIRSERQSRVLLLAVPPPEDARAEVRQLVDLDAWNLLALVRTKPLLVNERCPTWRGIRHQEQLVAGLKTDKVVNDRERALRHQRVNE